MNVKSRNYQRKWRYSRSRTPYWLQFLLALAAAALVHAVFFGVFTCKEQQLQQHEQKSKITLFNLGSLSENKGKHSAKWLQMHDPKLAVRGDSPIGFSSFVSEVKDRKITVREFKVPLDLPQAKPIKYIPRQVKSAAVPEIFELPVEIKKSIVKSQVIGENGKVLALDLGKIKVDAAGTSRFVLRGKGLLRRVEIIESCSAKQDSLAAGIIQNSNLPDGAEVAVVWVKEQK